MSSPRELIFRDDPEAKTRLWACSKCGRAYADKEWAESCCRPAICDCGAECDEPYTACRSCRSKKEQEQLAAAFEKAPKVEWSAFEGDCLCCPYCEKYSIGPDALLDDHEDMGGYLPTWAWGCVEKRVTIDAERFIADELERHNWFEEAFDAVTGLSELQAFLDDWTAKNIPPAYEPGDVVVTFEKIAAEREAELAEDA